nr:hypothetical protein B0A51_14193 [Rachicladosporium sp. CCFEE 5018]
MAERLPLETQAAYAAIIDDILATADLMTVSAKRIRKALQEKVGVDLTPHKDAITKLIMERFDKVHTNAASPEPAEPAPTTNGHTHGGDTPPRKKRKADTDDDDDLSSVIDTPPKKKPKKKISKAEAETDAEYAARLQAELNAVNSRSTRGGGAKRKAAVKKEKKPKKKSVAKLGADDDSELESGTAKPERPKTGAFHKPLTLSEPLAELLGESSLSRPQTVKRIWAYVKERDLQDPSDKRQIRCDEKMHNVFKQDKVHMFTMNKLLRDHLYAQDE